MTHQPVDRAAESALGFPTDGGDADKLVFLLRYAVAAPSGHNTQPWAFRVVDSTLEVRADRSRALPVVDPDDRELTISCGAALALLRVAIRHFGYAGEVDVLPDATDPDLLATVALGMPHRPDSDDDELFHAIAARHTCRKPFADRTVPRAVTAKLQDAAEREGCRLHSLTGEPARRLAALIAEGDRAQLADRAFRRELASWVRSNYSRRADGMPGSAFGVPGLPSLIGPLFMRTVDMGRTQARKDQRLALTAPVLAVMSTRGDSAADWVAAGQAAACVLLSAAARGLAGSFLNQPVQLPDLRRRVADLLDDGTTPQAVLRLGYATPDRHTPRRSVDDAVVS